MLSEPIKSACKHEAGVCLCFVDLDPVNGPAMVWNYIHAMRDFAVDFINGEDVVNAFEPDTDRGPGGHFEDTWRQWDNYTDINFWIDEQPVLAVGSFGKGIKSFMRYQVATAYLHPNGDNEQKFSCDTNLDDRCRIELYRKQI